MGLVTRVGDLCWLVVFVVDCGCLVLVLEGVVRVVVGCLFGCLWSGFVPTLLGVWICLGGGVLPVVWVFLCVIDCRVLVSGSFD